MIKRGKKTFRSENKPQNTQSTHHTIQSKKVKLAQLSHISPIITIDKQQPALYYLLTNACG